MQGGNRTYYERNKKIKQGTVRTRKKGINQQRNLLERPYPLGLGAFVVIYLANQVQKIKKIFSRRICFFLLIIFHVEILGPSNAESSSKMEKTRKTSTTSYESSEKQSLSPGKDVSVSKNDSFKSEEAHNKNELNFKYNAGIFDSNDPKDRLDTLLKSLEKPHKDNFNENTKHDGKFCIFLLIEKNKFEFSYEIHTAVWL